MSPLAPGLVLERDESAVEGRPKRSGETYYIVPGCQIIAVTTAAITGGVDVYSPWIARTPIVIDQLAAEVTTASGTNFRIGFYRADRDWQPFGAPLADSGNLDATTTGVKTYTPSTPIIVRPGRYLSVMNRDSNPGIRAFVSGGPLGALQDTLGSSVFVNSFRVTRAYAAFPTPGTAWDTDTAASTGPSYQFVVYRVLTP